MDLVINGEKRSVEGPATVSELLVVLGVNPKMIVVEQNGTILDKTRYNEAPVNEGDTLEIIRFVGGG